MAAPVWLLSVDLQAKTAVFTSGLADAAKKARGSFQDIKSGAQDMSDGSSRGFSDIRHSLGLLDNSIRGQHGAAMADAIRLTAQFVDVSSALPFAAMAGGFILVGGLIVEAAKKIQEFRQQSEKLTESEQKAGTTVNDVFNALDRKILEAGIRADELNNNHLAALHKQLELINMQSMSELVHSFGEISKAAEEVFGQLKSNWYTFGIGSAGAQHALEQFKSQYDLLLSEGKDKEAADLLAGTRASAERVLAMQKQMASSRQHSGSFDPDSQQKYNAYVAAENELKKAGVGITEKEIQAQEELVRRLADQAAVQTKVNALKGIQKGNAAQSTASTMGAEAFSQLRAQWDADRKAQEDAARLTEEAHNKAVAELQESERAKIAATEKGSAARVAAIAAALKEEETYGLQETSFYRELATQQIDAVRQMADEEQKLRAQAAKEASDHELKMGELKIALERESQQLLDSLKRANAQKRAQDEMKAANDEYAIKMKAYADDIAALNTHDKDYENQLRAMQNKEEELTRQHEDQITLIKAKAAAEQEQQQRQALTRMETGFATSFLSVLEHHQTFAGMMQSLSSSVVQSLITEAIAERNGLESTKLDEAKAAARKMYLAGTHFPWPTNIVMAPTLAAMGFAAMMAFEGGGIVPGVGKGDTVPAMLTPGESVLPKSLTEGLTKAANSGNMGGGHTYHLHTHYRPTIHAIDRSGVEEMLQAHSDSFNKHFHNELRKMNGR